MTTASSFALTGFIAWALLLLVLMEVIRAQLVLRQKVPANGFTPDNAGLSPFMQRLARAHANCVESLPVFGGLLLVAIVTDRTSVTDSFAYLLLGSRIFQSLVHLASLSPTAVTIRFTAFAVQMAIAMYWAFMLLASALSPTW
ncbi:MAG: MAPEG family protein [Pseudomonadota bacterium]